MSNPEKIALLTDSTADLPAPMREGKPIYVVPLKIRCEDGEYSDGVDITAEARSWQQALTALVTAVFGVLALVGVTTDPTTKGLGDSAQALTYHKPKDDREG